MKKKILTLAAVVLVAALTMNICVFASTPQDIKTKSQGSYTAGTSSVYGAKLSQDELNAVSNVVADFATNYVNSSMDNDAKIRAGYNYIKNNVVYVDWRDTNYANTAYGALVEKKAACSGMTRAFVALMDAVDVKAYWIHGNTNDHQWNMVEFNDGFYFIDIDANIASGGEYIYKAATHPYAYDTTAYPAIGSHSGQNTAGTQASTTEGWKQDTAGWRYQNTDGSYQTNAWRQVDGKWYYFEANSYMAANKWINGTYYVGSDGAMLVNTTTPDGYQVDGNGAWIKEEQSGNIAGFRCWDKNANLLLGIHEEGRPIYKTEYHNGDCYIVDKTVNSFLFQSSVSNINPNGHEVWVYGVTSINGNAVVLGEPKVYKFEFDQDYSFDFTGNHSSAIELAQYCIDNNITIIVDVVDRIDTSTDGKSSRGWNIKYATSSSVPTGEIGQ